MNDTITKKSAFILDALQYAHDHQLDINKLEDVQKILDVLDPDHKENVAEFANLLITSETFMDMEARKVKSEDPLPN